MIAGGAIAGGALHGCANVLGIPDEPRLAADAESPGAGAPDAGLGSSPEQSLPNNPGVNQTPSNPEQSNPSLVEPPDTTGSQQPEPAIEDAGVPADGPDATPVVDPCGAQRSLGPNGRCFTVLAALQTWADARESCQDLGNGWELASIRSEAVSQFVAGLISAEVWIIASDVDQEGRWVWMDDGTAFWNARADAGALNGEYANWNSTEPNGGNTTNCARIVPSVGHTWADLPCDSTVGALCEGPGP